ncbi:MAG: TonB-dependent receptor, partial [Tannerellaceae bacterium]|nr:TonB-dependent receptor [Tannerellaceae bacterium]
LLNTIKKSAFSLLMLLIAFGISAQEVTVVKGTVTDEATGETIIGASVVQKGTSNGVITDMNGAFTLNVPRDAVLSVSYIGYATQDVAVMGQTSLTIRMREDSQALDEVVVVGYGVQKKRDLTGAVSTVKMNDSPVQTMSTISHALAGKAAGLRVTQSTAQPGAGATFRIRGATSINASNDPLIIVDGFPVSRSADPGSGNAYQSGTQDNVLEMLNPNDIESIEVLKDASATAIYGSRAGHGVIIITTKRGKVGTPQITYSGNVATQAIGEKYKIMDASEYMRVNNMWLLESWRRDYGQGVYADYVTAKTPFVPWEDYVKNPRRLYSDSEIANANANGTYWMDEITRTGVQQSHNVSVTGGTDKSKYLASLNYFDQKGVIKNSEAKRITASLNSDYEFSKYLKAGLSFNMSRNYYDNVPLGMHENEYAGIIASAIVFEPTLPIRNPDGTFTESVIYNQTPNPVSLLDITDNTTKDRVIGQGYIQIEPVKDLLLKGTLGFDRRSAKRKTYLPTSTRMGRIRNGVANQNQTDGMDYLMSLTANYSKTFGQHSFTALAGYEFQTFSDEWFSAGSNNFPIDAFLYNKLGAGTNDKAVDSYAGSNSLASVFGRINYSFAGKYLLTATIRRDGASNFNPSYRWGHFPSVSVAWRFSDEAFMTGINYLISNGKLRAGYGETGNSSVGNRTQDFFGMGEKYVFGNTGTIGMRIISLGNPRITWETTSEWNFGIDLGFLDNRINLTAEYYDRVVSDLLVTNKRLPSYYEITSIAGNIGATQGQGLELTLNTVNVKQKDLVWTSDITYYTYKDRWKERDPNWIPNIYQSIDDPIRAIFSQQSDGLLKPGEPAPAWQKGLLPGQIKVKNLDLYYKEGDIVTENVIDAHDIVMIGTQDPDFSFGFNNTVRYKAFDLNIYLYGETGRWRTASYYHNMITALAGEFNGGLKNRSKNSLNSWSMDNQTATVPNFLQSASYAGDYYISQVWYVRCRNITLGYQIPVPKQIAKAARIYASVSNPFIFTNWTGLDPETDYNTWDSGYENAGNYSYPNVRTFSVGIDISF